MNNWLKLPLQRQKELFNQISSNTGLPPFAVEKDAWVTLSLRMLFNSSLSDNIVFKGGTSLSKCYNLINRLSEDIDIALDRKYLGFGDALSKAEIRKLRKSTHSFVVDKLPNILTDSLNEYGIESTDYEISVENTEISDQDPETLLIKYNSVFDDETYLKPSVKIELGGRSLIEPSEEKEITSLIDEQYKDSDFVENKFIVKAVLPEKTLIEKMILLHEEFHKPLDKIKTNRMSRHLYDIYQIMQTPHFLKASKDNDLFTSICEHRANLTPLKSNTPLDYSSLTFNSLQVIPQDNIIDDYRRDYNEMRTSMFFGDSPTFDTIIEQLQTFSKKP